MEIKNILKYDNITKKIKRGLYVQARQRNK